jgi:hypothetical protein
MDLAFNHEDVRFRDGVRTWLSSHVPRTQSTTRTHTIIGRSTAATEKAAVVVAATGARVVTSAIYELQRRGGGFGVLAMWAGSGKGFATVIEVS